jgi:uroporphyrinogen III methyltransferase/synthase
MEEKEIPFEDSQRIVAYAVGPATAEALASRGIAVHTLPDSFQAEGLAALLETEKIEGKQFLFPRARKAREWLPRFLEEKGARVDVAVVYETRKAVENKDLLLELLATEKLDYLTFTSSSTVQSFVEFAGPRPSRGTWQTLPAACIGEVTADVARAEGFDHILTARPSTIPGLVQVIVDHVEGKS